MLLVSAILNFSEYMPNYIERTPEPCPHCGHKHSTRTNRYLVRCNNPDCGRYY